MDNLQKKIVKFSIKEFQIGRTYLNENAEAVLIHHIWDDDRAFPMIGSFVVNKNHMTSLSFTKEGKYHLHFSKGNNLIL